MSITAFDKRLPTLASNGGTLEAVRQNADDNTAFVGRSSHRCLIDAAGAS